MAEAPPPSGEPSLSGGQVRRASLLMLGGTLFGHALRFGSNLAMVRLLDDEAYFRQQALIVSFLQLLELLTDVGIWLSIVRSPRGLEPRFLDTAWTIQILRGVLLCGAALVGAPLFAAFYRDGELCTLVWFASTTLLIGGFSSAKLYVYRRQLRVRPILAIDLGAQVAGITGSILFALCWPSTMALVVGGIVASGTKTLASHLLPGRRDRLAWDRTALAEVVQVGVWTFVNTLLSFLAMQDRLVLGRFSTEDGELGVYYIAWILAYVPTGLVSSLCWSVLLPLASKHARGEADPSQAMLASRRPFLLLGGSSLSVLAACAPSVIALLYPPEYANAGWMLRWIATGMWLGIILEQSRAALFASANRLRWSSLASGAKLLSLALFIPLGYHWGGFAGGVAGFVCAELPRLGTTWFLAREARLAGARQDLTLSAIYLAALGFGGAVEHLVLEASGTPLLAIPSSALVAALIWLPCSWRHLRDFSIRS